jgi:endoglucanase
MGQSLTSHIRVNQIGYYVNTEKRAIVEGATGSFTIVDANTQSTVYTGTLSNAKNWTYSNENVSVADFSQVTTPGIYYLVVSSLGKSYNFEISDNIYDNLAIGSTKAYYYQRASTSLPTEFAGTWQRNAGHPDDNVLVHSSAASAERPTNTVLSSPKGWYDAGDYNKYIVNSGISTFTFLHLYETMPDYFTNLELNIPETGNGIPDILNEALWNLEWMLTMQDPNDGGVYHKLTTADFEGWVMPEDAHMQRYVVQKGTAATLDFAAIMAMSARIFAEFETELPGFSETCLAAARSAWDWARINNNVAYSQSAVQRDHDPDIDTGEYPDDYFKDELSWAAAELFLTTGEQQYYNEIDYFEGEWNAVDIPDWQKVKALGLLSLITNSDRVTTADNNLFKSELFLLTDEIMNEYNTSAYKTSLGMYSYDFTWGSNAIVGNHAMLLLDAHRIDDTKGYFEAAVANMDYLLGKNPLNKSYVSGFGTDYPLNIHHRQSGSDNLAEPVPGFLAGGPNQWASDGVSYSQHDPATQYSDVRESWATNEITINWNAPLMYCAHTIHALQSGVTPPPPPSNYPPVVVIDYSSSVESGQTVNLDALGSSDADGDTLSFNWSSADGLVFSSNGSATTSFEAPEVTTATDYAVTLTVSDGTDNTVRSFTITINPPPNNDPVIVLDFNNSVTSGEMVTVDASGSYDNDGDALTYNWTSPDGLSLLSNGSETTSFVAPDVTVATGYRVKLALSDGIITKRKTVTITVNPEGVPVNNDPVIVLDYVSSAESGSLIDLDASASYDTDGDALTYSWTSDDSEITFTSTTGEATSFYAPTVTSSRVINITVTVSDGTVTIDRTVAITINPAQSGGGDEPIVIVDYEINTHSGYVTDIDASDSYAPDGKQLTFNWSTDEDVFISSNNSPQISFLAPDVFEDTPITFNLEVTDGSITSNRVVEITVVPYKPDLEEIIVASVRASGYEEQSYPENIIDNDKSTSWKIRGQEQWLVIETQKPVSLSHFKLSVTDGIENNALFDVFASEDGFEWELVMGQEESCGLSTDYQVFDIPSTKSEVLYNYIKLIGKGTSKDDINDYAELKLYAGTGSLSDEKVLIEDIMEVYPNPAQYNFNLDLKEDSNVRIINLNGQVVFEEFLQQGVNSIDINLPSGSYMIQVLGESQMVSQQLIIQ